MNKNIYNFLAIIIVITGTSVLVYNYSFVKGMFASLIVFGITYIVMGILEYIIERK